MATKKTLARNRMVESVGGGFRKTAVDAPAVEHQRLPVSFVGVTSPDEFDCTPDNDVVSVDATAHAVNVQLPSASGLHGVDFTIKNRKGAHTVTVVPYGSESIDDQTSIALANMGDAITVTAIDDAVETGWIITACVTGLS